MRMRRERHGRRSAARALVVLALAACGGTEPDESDDPDDPEPPATVAGHWVTRCPEPVLYGCPPSFELQLTQREDSISGRGLVHVVDSRFNAPWVDTIRVVTGTYRGGFLSLDVQATRATWPGYQRETATGRIIAQVDPVLMRATIAVDTAPLHRGYAASRELLQPRAP